MEVIYEKKMKMVLFWMLNGKLVKVRGGTVLKTYEQ